MPALDAPDFDPADLDGVGEDLAAWDIAEARERRGAFRWGLRHGAFARRGPPPRLPACRLAARARSPHRTGRRVTVATSTAGAGDGDDGPAEPPRACFAALLLQGGRP